MGLIIRCSVATSMKKVYMGVFSAIWLVASVRAFTDSQDVFALNQLYSSLGSPGLTGWTANGGDPCAENWEGVACAGPNVTLLNLTGLGLTGGPSIALQNLTALIVLDLSHNLLSGGLPVQLPPHVQQLDLSANEFTGNVPLAFSELSNLAVLNISSNLLSGTLADMFNPLGGLTTMDFSNNGFDGSLPPSFATLTNLNTLYLEQNSFTGTIDVLANLPLTELDLSNNSFTGWIPLNLQNFSSSMFTGNSFSTSPAPPPPPPAASLPPSSPVGSRTQSAAEKSLPSKQTRGLGGHLAVGQLVGIAVAAFLLVVVAVLIVLYFCSSRQDSGKENKYDAESLWHENHKSTWEGHQKRSYVRAEVQKEELELEVKAPPKTYKSSEFIALKPPPVRLESLRLGKSKGSTPPPRVRPVVVTASIAAQAYTIAELQLATQSFAEENLLGGGTLGKVYKAQMPNGQVVAIKKLDYSMTRMGQEHFLEFLSKIARLRHPNIVELVGYCVEHGEHLLVYGFVGNGTVQENVHLGSDNRTRLSWKVRVKIALGVARALEYLHEKCKPAIFHQNLTSANILLNNDFNPLLSDCGLASFFQHEQASAERLRYSAPEHTSSGIYTTESDTYSFGVIMLELLTGREPLDSSRPRSQHLVRWAVPQLHDIDALTKMLDPTIEGAYSRKSVSRFADVISQCVQADPEFRPSMSEVVQNLEQLQNM